MPGRMPGRVSDPYGRQKGDICAIRVGYPLRIMVMAFDIDKFQQESARLAYDDLDFGEFSARPLSPEVLR
jgi:hypothetical protein